MLRAKRMPRGEVWRVTLEPTVGDLLIKKSRLKHPTTETGFFGENTSPSPTYDLKNPVSGTTCVSPKSIHENPLGGNHGRNYRSVSYLLNLD